MTRYNMSKANRFSILNSDHLRKQHNSPNSASKKIRVHLKNGGRCCMFLNMPLTSTSTLIDGYTSLL